MSEDSETDPNRPLTKTQERTVLIGMTGLMMQVFAIVAVEVGWVGGVVSGVVLLSPLVLLLGWYAWVRRAETGNGGAHA